MGMVKKALMAVFALTLLSGCFVKVNTAPVGSSSGVFYSSNGGQDWSNISRLLTTEENNTFAGTNIQLLQFDPKNPDIIYAGGAEGLFYSIDAGKSWQMTLNRRGTVNAIAVHPSQSCVLLAGVSNQIYKSTDCARTWEAVLTESKSEAYITSLAADAKDPAVIYAASSSGSLYKSKDSGSSWQSAKFFNKPVRYVAVSWNNSNHLYVALDEEGLLKSVDRGLNWINTTEINSKEMRGITNFHELRFSPFDSETLYYVSDYGIVWSSDGGTTWQPLNLLTPPASAYIYSLAIGHEDEDVLYYSTIDTLYSSRDGGQSWQTKSLPTSRTLRVLRVRPGTNDILYAGAGKPIN
ncbi:MAG: hypothetical protein NUV82_00265 [Candidatus Komeilibacteria bacterium]|nr:hypothetical protein [Candidatus Komeilibacteria bacterium]